MTLQNLPLMATEHLASRYPRMCVVLLIAATYGSFVFERM